MSTLFAPVYSHSSFAQQKSAEVAGFKAYLMQSLYSPFVLNLEDSNLMEIIRSCVSAKTKLHRKYRESLGCLIHNLSALEREYGITLMPVQVTDIFWGYFISFCHQRGLKSSTIGTMCNQLRSILNWAIKYNAKVSPTYNDVQIPRSHNTEIALTADEVSRITYFDIDRFYANRRKDFRETMHKVRDIGFDEPVRIEERVNGELVVQNKPKWKMIASHTARRTATTISILRGHNIHAVKRCTGHTDLRSLDHYVRDE